MARRNEGGALVKTRRRGALGGVVGFAIALQIASLCSIFIRIVDAGCEYYTNCGSCVADSSCGWCGNDPFQSGGYGATNHGDHITNLGDTEPIGYGEGMVYTDGTGFTVYGFQTRFTKVFRGGGVQRITIGSETRDIERVVSDEELTLKIAITTAVANTAKTSYTVARHIDSTGSIYLDTTPTSMPESSTTQLVNIIGTSTKFTKELKVGYWLVIYGTAPATPTYRVITSIISDTSLTVDYDLNGVLTQVSGSAVSGSASAATSWGYISCPPRIGKRGVGLGTIQNHKEDQSGTYKSVAANSATTTIEDASGSATGNTVRIAGQGTRFASQLGAVANWATNSYTSGPWMSVQINGDWETVQVKDLGTSSASSSDSTNAAYGELYAEFVAELYNSFSEPLLKATHFEYYTMLTKGYGKIRSYGKRVVSNSWGNKEGFVDTNGATAAVAGSLSSTGVYGDTRFLTQLRTGYTITACGQTRMVNSIQSDVELTIDRPFTLGNIEYIQSTSGTDNRANLIVRGLTRLLPLWPRGVTVQIVSASTSTFTYTLYWKTFNNVYTASSGTPSSGGTQAAVTASDSVWHEITDSEVAQAIGVFIKWTSGTPMSYTSATDYDEWRLHVADIENCQYHISTEGERFMTDDNLNPPICYNHGRCVNAQSTSDSSRPSEALSGTSTVAAGVITGISTSFLAELIPGDIVTFTDDSTGATDFRVVSVASDTSATLDDTSGTLASAGTINVKRCAAGRFDGTDHETTATIIDDTEPGAYVPHPKLTFYHTYSHLYCEIDPGCCGFRLSSVVDPQLYAYYFVKPDQGFYNFRIAVHTVNDNLDLYTNIGTTRPTTASYAQTSVRESVPWAIDVDESDLTCSSASYLAPSILGGGTYTLAAAADAYNSAMGKYIHAANSPNCDQVTVGVMGDNRYPQTVGASEYTARVYMEFNFPHFACNDSNVADVAYGANYSYTPKCIQHNLRFAGDAKSVYTNSDVDSSQLYVVRLTESYARYSSTVSSVWKATTDFRTSQRSGAVWWHRKVHVWDGFETNFEFRITNPTQCGGVDQICDGADGFAFVITNDERQEFATSFHTNDRWACTGTDSDNAGNIAYTLCDKDNDPYPASGTAGDGGLVGCPGDGLGYGQSTEVDSASFNAVPTYCDAGLQKSLAVEFDTFYNVERRDPKQGKQHWWINATEFVSYSDNHLGVFMTTDIPYVSQPWGTAEERLTADHSDDASGAHFGSTPSVPTLADGLKHTVKIRYTRGFTTEKAGTGTIATSVRDITGTSTLFTTELRTGFEFGYDSRVKANVKIKVNLDRTDYPNSYSGGSSLIEGDGYGPDGHAIRVYSITSDTSATLMGNSAEPTGFEEMNDDAGFPTAVDTLTTTNSHPVSYNIIKEFPGEIQVFIDDMDRYVFQVAVEDRDMAKILDVDGNAYVGLTASTGSKGFAKVGYTPASVHQTTDIYSWNFCGNPGCVPY